MPYKIAYFGTPEFALAPLEVLSKDERFTIDLVVTQSAKPVGRDQTIQNSPVENWAREHHVPCVTPEKFKDNLEFRQILSNLNADFLVVAAYGKIIPFDILSSAKFGAINIHPSLLPKYRGASPLQSAIVTGETQTGVTIMVMDSEMDHGPLLWQAVDKIDPSDTTESLGHKLFALAAQALPEILSDLALGKIKPTPQNDALATTTKLLDRQDGRVDHTMPSAVITNKWRAYQPWPGIWFEAKQGKVKILDGAKVENCSVSGEVHLNKTVHFRCTDGCFEMKMVQPESKKPMMGLAWFHGLR